MNAAQNSKYWRRWTAVCRKNNWQFTKGRMSAEAVLEASPHHEVVCRLAMSLADKACRAVIANDLRHACHIHAFGRDVSHADFTNAQFDRLLILIGNERDIPGLLIEPLHIAAQLAWDNPDIARKNSLIRSIRDAADDGYISSITLDVWGTTAWQELDAPALLGLLRKIKGNAPAQAGNPF